MGYLGLAVLSDNSFLLVLYCIHPGDRATWMAEIDMRLYPTFVHIVGLLAFSAGLFVANPRPQPIMRNYLSRSQEIDTLRAVGLIVTIIGFVLVNTGYFLAVAQSDIPFYRAIDTYRSGDTIQGGFWYRGTDIAVFGLALIFASIHSGWKRRLAVLAAMMSLTFFFTTNKGGPEKALLWCLIVSAAYNRYVFRRLAHPAFLIGFIILVFVTTGLKSMLLTATLQELPVSSSTLADTSITVIKDRFSHEGLYRGYCSWINYFQENPSFHYGDKVGSYTLASVIPRIVYPDKPDNHPFRRIGYIINPDSHVYDRECSAITFVGYGYADQGFLSMIIYLLVGGFLLSLVRRMAAGKNATLMLHISYVFFCMFPGVSSETGFLGFFYALLYIGALTSMTTLCLMGICFLRYRSEYQNRFLAVDSATQKYVIKSK